MFTDIYLVIEHLRGYTAEITYVMAAAGRHLARGSGGRVIALLLGHQASSLVSDLDVDQVLYLDHPGLEHFTSDGYLESLEAVLPSCTPRAILFGHTSVGMDVASGLSARLDLPLVSQCRHFSIEESLLKFVSQICGGKMMAEGELPQPTALVTLTPGGYKPDQGKGQEPPEIVKMDAPPLDDLRIRLVAYHEPETGDVDISTAPFLISVGRGLQNQDDLELVEELAEALGGSVCASRPIIDQGWLPTTRLVGKSGKMVKPIVYLALGISGAPEHVEGITNSDLIIAINTDPEAPIFDVAQFGAEVDMFDLLDALKETIQHSRVA